MTTVYYRKQKPLNAPHIMLLLPATLINKRYSPEHEEFHACASILNPLTDWLQLLLVVYLVKLRLTSLKGEWLSLICTVKGHWDHGCKGPQKMVVATIASRFLCVQWVDQLSLMFDSILMTRVWSRYCCINNFMLSNIASSMLMTVAYGWKGIII